MSGPQETNQTAEKVNGLIGSLMGLLTQLAIQVLAGKLPILNLPGLRNFWKWLVEQQIHKVTVLEKQYATEAIIDHQKKAQVQEAKAAGENLRQAIVSKDEEAIRKANEEFNKKYAKLVHYGGHSNVNN